MLRDDCFWEGPIDSGPIPKSGEQFDILVVGGGPGGSAAAFYAAKRGLRVLLLERRVFPDTKVCGDAVGGRSLSFIKEMGIKERLESGAHFRVLGITFSDGKNFIEISWIADVRIQQIPDEPHRNPSKSHRSPLESCGFPTTS